MKFNREQDSCLVSEDAASKRENHVRQLTEFLAGNHPMLKRYMGQTRFTALARAFSAQHPSETPNNRWYSSNLAKFQRATQFFARQPELAEMAELESALNDALNAPDAPVVTQAELDGYPPSELASMTLALSPSLRRFKVRTNVTSLWSSLRCEEFPPHPFMLDADQELLVWRQRSTARFRMLGNDEAMALDAAINGVSISGIRKTIATADETGTADISAATFLRGWIEAEIISELRR